MRRGLSLLGVLAALAGGAAAEDEAVAVLEDGTPHRVLLRQGRATWTGRVEVPADALALGVVAVADADVDLFLRRARPVADDFEAESDAFRRGHEQAEVLLLGAGAQPAPQSGTWFVTVEHPRAAFRAAQIEVTAFVDRPGVPRTVLAGHPLLLDVTGPTPLRTLLPQGARRLTATLAGRGAEGASLVLSVGGFRRRAPPTQSLSVDADEIAAGPAALALEPAPGEPGPRKVSVDVAWEFAPPPSATEAPPLLAGTTELVLLGGDSPHTRTFRVDVPEGVPGFVVEQHNDAHADVDLYARRDAPPEIPEHDADWLGITTGPEERLVVAGVNALLAGRYFVEVSLYVEGPVVAGVTLRWLAAGERERTWGAADPPPLPPGAWQRGRTDPAASGIVWYALDPPAGTRSLHALLLDSTAPLDLVLARRTDGSVLARAVTGRVDERLDFAFPAPLPADRRFLLGVVSLTPGEGPADYRVAAAFDRPPALPADLAWPRLLPLTGLGPDERVAAATVELTGERSGGGSATCISPRGLLLSCRHVLEDPDEPGALQRDGILVAFSRSLDRPPVQSFLARVVLEDATLDLALLELTEDVFGRALPAELALPWVALGDSDALHLGDPVTVLGYPQEGSEFTRTPVILSRGSVAGFESAGGVRTSIKTDAWIGPGHSGGTLVDREHRLVAVPAATLGDKEAMGLCVPVARLPAAWRARLAQDLK